MSAAIRIILKSLYNSRNSILITLKINKTIVLLVPTALVTNRDTAIIIATTITRLLFKKWRIRLSFI